MGPASLQSILTSLIIPPAKLGIYTIGWTWPGFNIRFNMSWDWRKIFEVLIFAQVVIKRVMEAAQASTATLAPFHGNYSQSINHVAHLLGVLIGVVLVWLVGKVPSEPREQENSMLHQKTDEKF
ncbi:hypothetical protein CRG98_021664 [Punica granatum]|uniref:Peptidase S54 rhomboid domain-containing protein n=1 Tax=Punica granatum TaxID=22663 RepID=A0A2I0JNV0_PUNGR|nr:hypothetical protein CRG98_021664 [Punica granatum]